MNKTKSRVLIKVNAEITYKSKKLHRNMFVLENNMIDKFYILNILEYI